ncbi:MAG: septum formation initiator family protein [Gemmatimonadota bacterium]
MGRLKKLVLPALLLAAGYYALFGGEYSYLELRRTRAREARERAQVTELRRQIDSLRAWADSLEVDSATLERIARERFGMIREGEVLYRFTEPRGRETSDSTGDTGR